MAKETELDIWLEQIGLGKYADLFKQQAIDIDVIGELRDADLVELGLPMGHRKKLLRAIGEREAEAAGPRAPQKPNVAAAGGHSMQSERRQLTVMICDLVGSTQLSQEFDPEELSTILTAYQHCCEKAIIDNHGTITRYMGDGIFAYFGFPQADEIDAERAIRAGLDIVRNLQKIRPFGIQLETRVGIATGIVVIGDLVGEGPGQVEAVVGEAPNLAARLEALAETDTVVIAESTRRLAEHSFEYDDLGTHSLKGFTEPMQAWQVLGESRLGSRSEALGMAIDLTPMVDREDERELLRRRWEQARGGAGKAVLISGEPGIGKSRLLQSLREELASEHHVPMRCFCSPHYQNSTLHPAIEFLIRLLNFKPDDTPIEKLEKLEQGLVLTGDDREIVAPLLADLLSIPTGNRYPPVKLQPQGRKLRVLEALEIQLMRTAALQPVLLIFEDLHWADPTTVELLDRLVEKIAKLPVLLILTYRPEFIPPWPDYHHVSTLILNQLSQEDSSVMVECLTREKALPKELVKEILDKTDGNPLFIEELHKAIIQNNVLEDQGDRYALQAPVSSISVPSTLADSFMARLDKLNRVKDVAQTAAVIGRRFSYDLLVHVCGLSELTLAAALNQLAEAQIVYRHGTGKNASYYFKHALLQDAAYSSLLNRKRQALHAAVVEALEQHDPVAIRREPEVIAHHCTGAGLVDKAIDYWQKAGQRAFQKSGVLESIDHFEKGLDLLRKQSDSNERAGREIELLMSIGPALSAAKGFASPEVEAAYASAISLSRQVSGGQEDFSILRRLWVYHFIAGHLDQARDIAEQLMTLAASGDEIDRSVEAHRVLGQTLFYQGNFLEAREHLEKSVACYDPEKHRSGIYLYGNDSATVCRAYLGLVLWFLGYPEQAVAQCEKTLKMARELQHPFSLALALAFSAYVRQHLRDAKATALLATETITVSEEQGFPFWAHQEAILLGWALAEQGQVEEGMTRLCRGLEEYTKMGSGLACPWFLGLKAEVKLKVGDPDRALSIVDEAAQKSDEIGDFSYLAEIYRLKGTITLAKLGDKAAGDVEALYQESLAVARKQGARSWELRTATDLAILWQQQKRVQEARDLLRTIYDGFEEGFETHDLKRARDLLAELGDDGPKA